MIRNYIKTRCELIMTKKNLAYLIGICIIFICAIIINTQLTNIVKGLIKILPFNNQKLYEKIAYIHENLDGIINAYSLTFTFVIIAYLNSRIGSLNYPNKVNRAIWRLYEISINTLEGLGLILEIDNNEFVIIMESNKRKGEKEIKKEIGKCIKERWGKAENNRNISMGNTLTGNKQYRKEEMFVKVINELNLSIESAISSYIEFIPDKIYKYVAQISYESRRYNFTSNKKIKEYETEILIKYFSELIYNLNKINEKWYEYHKREIRKYNKENKRNTVYVLGEKSIRNKRLEQGKTIEEICNKIHNLSGNKYKIKTEILYRLIENGKVNVNRKDKNRILSVLQLVDRKFKYFNQK